MRKIKNLPHASEQAADPRGEGTIQHDHVDDEPKAQRRASIQGKPMGTQNPANWKGIEWTLGPRELKVR